MAEDADFIRSLIEEARTMKTKPLPGTLSLAWHHPGVAAHGVDTQAEWDDDQRRAHVLKRLSAKYPGGTGLNNPGWRREMLRYELGELPDIDSPYHRRGSEVKGYGLGANAHNFFRGAMSPGAPLHNWVQYMGAFPSMAYSLSGMAANSVDPDAPYDPDAKKRWDSSFNTAFAYLPEAAGLVPKGTKTYADVAEEARHARGMFPWDVTHHGKGGREEYTSAMQSEAAAAASDLYTDGTEHYMRQGMPRLPALFAGALSDSMLDPYSGWAAAGQAARQGRAALAAWNLAKEWGVGQAAAGLAASQDAMRR